MHLRELEGWWSESHELAHPFLSLLEYYRGRERGRGGREGERERRVRGGREKGEREMEREGEREREI